MSNRTKKIKIGGITFTKRLRKPTAQERLENKEHRAYYRKNKSKIARQTKLRKAKLKRNPRELAKIKFKAAVKELVKSKGMTIIEAIRHLRTIK